MAAKMINSVETDVVHNIKFSFTVLQLLQCYCNKHDNDY